MAEDKESAKWASEAFEFIRLFERMRSSISGLLMLIIGWAILLGLVANLSADDKPASLLLPSFSGPYLELPLSAVFAIGSVAVAALWTVSSGLYLYIALPFRHVIRHAAIAVSYPLMFVAAALALILSFPLYHFVERARVTRWKRANPAEVEALRKKLELETELDSAIAQYKTKFVATDKLAEWLIQPWVLQNSAMRSAGYVGLSPLYSYSLEEDQKAAKAPRQVFAGAIARLRYEWTSLQVVKHMRFVVLPALPRIESDDAARRLRRWLGLDVLLWGSYVSVRPPKLWLNVQQARVEPVSSARDDDDRAARDARIKQRPKQVFDGGVTLPLVSSLLLDQDDPRDAYIVVAISLLQATENRRDATKRTRRFLPLRFADRLAHSSDEQVALRDELIRSVLFELSGPLPSTAGHVSAKQALVVLASDWVAERVYRDQSSLEKAPHLMHAVIAKCVELDPKAAEHRYRLGAVRCLLDDEAGALEAFQQAAALEQPAAFSDPSFSWSVACHQIEDLDHGRSYGSNPEIAAATVARAVRVGGAEARQKLVTVFQKTASHELGKLGARLGTAERVLLRLLELPPPAAVRQDDG